MHICATGFEFTSRVVFHSLMEMKTVSVFLIFYIFRLQDPCLWHWVIDCLFFLLSVHRSVHLDLHFWVTVLSTSSRWLVPLVWLSSVFCIDHVLIHVSTYLSYHEAWKELPCGAEAHYSIVPFTWMLVMVATGDADGTLICICFCEESTNQTYLYKIDSSLIVTLLVDGWCLFAGFFCKTQNCDIKPLIS